jgi:RimJ/RimL family protein N-acetyltransferase
MVLRPRYPLTTDRLELRPFREDDLDVLCEMDGDAETTRYLYWGPRTRAEVRVSLARRRKMTSIEREGDGLRLAIVVKESGALVGDVSLHYLSKQHGQGEIGFVLHPAQHGHGYAGEAVRVLLGLGFEGLGLHRIAGRCDPRNTASARLMDRLGMRREAHLRENEYVKGEWVGGYVYALLADEWRATKGNGA